MVRSFFALYVGMLVVNLVLYLNNYIEDGVFNFMLDDFISPIPYAGIGAVIIYIVRKLNIKSDDEEK